VRKKSTSLQIDRKMDDIYANRIKKATMSAIEGIKDKTMGGATDVSGQIQEESAYFMERAFFFAVDSRITGFVAGALLGIGVTLAFVKYSPWACKVVDLSKIKASSTTKKLTKSEDEKESQTQIQKIKSEN
jgi:hypothetical protein